MPLVHPHGALSAPACPYCHNGILGPNGLGDMVKCPQCRGSGFVRLMLPPELIVTGIAVILIFIVMGWLLS